MGRTQWYESLNEMQADLGDYLKQYNYERPHQGININGKNPYTVLIEGLPKKDESDTKNLKLAAQISNPFKGELLVNGCF